MDANDCTHVNCRYFPTNLKPDFLFLWNRNAGKYPLFSWIYLFACSDFCTYGICFETFRQSKADVTGTGDRRKTDPGNGRERSENNLEIIKADNTMS